MRKLKTHYFLLSLLPKKVKMRLLTITLRDNELSVLIVVTTTGTVLSHDTVAWNI